MAPKKRNTSPPSPSSPSSSGAVGAGPGGGSKRPTRPGFSVTQLAALFVFLLVANYLGVAWFQEWWSTASSPADSASVYRVSGAVQIRQLPSPDADFAEECRAGGLPIVLRNSVVEKWRARHHWTPKYLQSRIPRMNGVYQNDNRWFGPYYDSSKPLAHFSTRTNNYAINVSMSTKKFFKKLKQPLEGEFLYFTGDIDQLGEWAMEDIQPLSELLVLNPRRSSVNVWMGQPHVIAHCHYDGYHNFYAQLHGTKKFTLFSPENWPGLYPYPFLHPSHTQAQVNLSNIRDIDSFPLAGEVKGLEVTLRPGDLLYMPPLWFHLVESMDTSISVNVWTDSVQTLLVEDMFAVPLPTETVDWSSSHQKAIATSVTIHSLLTEVCHRRHCRQVKDGRFLDNQDLRPLDGELYFVYQLWTTRYRTLMEEGPLPNGVHDPTSTSDGILCERMSNNESKTEREAATVSLFNAGLKEYVERVAGAVEKLPDETWDLWTGNYVEYLAATVVQVEMVGAFLRHYGSCILH